MTQTFVSLTASIRQTQFETNLHFICWTQLDLFLNLVSPYLSEAQPINGWPFANHGGINNRLRNRMEGLSPNDLNPDQGGQNFCLSCRNAPILICTINNPFGSCHTYLSGTFRLSRGGGNGKIWHPLEHSSVPKLLGDPILLLFLSVGNYWGHQQLRHDHPLSGFLKRECVVVHQYST